MLSYFSTAMPNQKLDISRTNNKLIVFEGIDGSGKSTHLQRAADWIHERGYPVVIQREPTEGPFGRKLRDSALNGRLSPQEETDLFIRDRLWNARENIEPALRQGETVLLDRYYFSTIAYQSARGLDPEEIRRKNEAFAPRPDLVLLFDLDPEIALDRIREKRGESPNLFEKLEYLRQVRENFLKLSDPFIRRIDASLSIEDVWLQVKEAIEPLFPGKTSP